MSSEEEKVIQQENSTEVLTAFNKIPYALLNSEVTGNAKDVLNEFTEICKYYKVYKKGAKFNVEGTNGDYVPATLRYKMASSLINKEARFLFAETPDIVVEAKGDLGKTTDEAKDALTVLNDVLNTIFQKNKFEDALIKAAKDCFIGKRVACLVNFNEEDGVTISFLPSTQFVYDTQIGNTNVLTKFVSFIIVKDSLTLSDKRIFKKKFVFEDDGEIWLEEVMYDGAGKEIEVVTEYQPTLLKTIPAVIIVNDGLTGEEKGESEIDVLSDYEQWYSKLANADIDAGRKSMNPTKYVTDMDSRSTKNLSTAPGSLWDLGTDQNLDNSHPLVGMLEPAMSYSNPLKTTLDRIKTVGYEQLDMPNITLESMQGSITTGKALKAIYWPLITRCKEKMKTWGPQLSSMVEIIIEGAMVYPNCFIKYTDDPIVPVAYEVKVAQNLPLPEDEAEEKNIDLSEVESMVMSKKAYMKKWRGLTDDEVDEELQQMALERQMLEDSTMTGMGTGEDAPPYGSDTQDTMGEGGEMDEEVDTSDFDIDEDTELDDMLSSFESELDMM